MSLSTELQRNLRDILAELHGNPEADVRVWLQHMVSLAELIQSDVATAENYSSGRTVVNQADTCPRTLVRSPDTFIKLEQNLSADIGIGAETGTE